MLGASDIAGRLGGGGFVAVARVRRHKRLNDGFIVREVKRWLRI